MERLPAQPWMTDPATRAVLAALSAAGEPVRFVGGCVRDALIGFERENVDIDLATPLLPDAVIAAAEAAGLRAVPTGMEHGTVTIVADHRPFEVTTLRRDVETDGRRAVVAFTRHWAEDAARRDFRLNALYADPDGTLHDPTGGGMDDARAGRIVFVGDPETRIREDYLRILRFFRFTAWYGRAAPHAESLAACTRLKDGLNRLSAERLGKETLKLLAAADPRTAVRLMRDSGVLAELLPRADDLHHFEALAPLSDDALLRLAALLPDAEAGAAVAARLRLSNAQRDRLLAALAPEPRVRPDDPSQSVRAALYAVGAQTVADRLRLSAAERGGDPAELLALAAEWTPKRLPVTGADLQALGLPPGPELGSTLRRLEQAWIASDFQLDHQALIAMAAELHE